MFFLEILGLRKGCLYIIVKWKSIISKSLSPNGESVDIELNGNLDFGQMYVYPKNN